MKCIVCKTADVLSGNHQTAFCRACSLVKQEEMDAEMLAELDVKKIKNICAWCHSPIDDKEFKNDKVARYMRRGNACRVCSRTFTEACETGKSRKYRKAFIKEFFHRNAL